MRTLFPFSYVVFPPQEMAICAVEFSQQQENTLKSTKTYLAVYEKGKASGLCSFSGDFWVSGVFRTVDLAVNCFGGVFNNGLKWSERFEEERGGKEKELS
jgi:hypothetical protein